MCYQPCMARERAEYRDVTVSEFDEQTKPLDNKQLLERKAFYQKQCYRKFINIEKRNQAFQKCTDSLEAQSVVVKGKAGEPSSSTLEI